MTLRSAVTRAALLVALEGVALVVLGLAYGAAGLLGEPTDRTGTVIEAGMLVVLGVLVLAVARGLHRTAGWSRAPAVVLQLLALPVGASSVQAGLWWAAVPLIGLAGAVLYHLATAEARAALAGQD